MDHKMIFLILLAKYLSLFMAASDKLTVAPKLAVFPKPAAASDNAMPVEEKILKDLSFPLRLTFMKELINKNKTNNNTETKCNAGSKCGSGDSDASRPVGLQALSLPSRKQGDAENDDNNMKMKLFRLMYETVRDSDLKVKRAELIKKSYVNSSSFEVGYLLGDVTDKFNIMSDISLTLKRLHREWKPIEHINAYEQIANMGIEISQIVELIKSVEKRIHHDEQESRNKPKANITINIPGFL